MFELLLFSKIWSTRHNGVKLLQRTFLRSMHQPRKLKCIKIYQVYENLSSCGGHRKINVRKRLKVEQGLVPTRVNWTNSLIYKWIMS